MANCAFFILRILAKECLFTKNIATAYNISNLLLIWIRQGYHKASIEHEVYVVHILALFEQQLFIVNFADLWALNYELIRVVAYFGQYFMVQSYSFQA